jgi:serine/threonine-protein kinase
LRRALEPWAKAERASTTPSPEIDRGDITTVVLLQPTGDPARQYLGFAVHEAIASRLGKLPRIRVLSRVRDTEPDATVVEFDAGAQLTLAVRGVTAVTLPLGPEHLLATANTGTALIVAALRADRSPMPERDDVVDLVLRARYLMHHDFDRFGEVLELLERAHAMSPDNPIISSTLANAHVRMAFFGMQSDPEELVYAASLAREALRTGPELAESHLAAGHVELHSGDPAAAALHYRKALARSPHTNEAHEYLGRLLLEAGYVDLGLARLEEALASALALASTVRTQWDIARAYALDGRWADHDRLLAEIGTRGGGGRALLLARFGWWRGDLGPLRALRAQPDNRMFGREVVGELVSVFLDGAWPAVRASLLAWAREPIPNRRRLTLQTQLVAEAAGSANDVDTCVELVTHAVDHGLFDLHWVDKCPALASARATAAFATQRARVLRRAEAILDAFYGDRPDALSETAIAPSALTP